VGPVDALAHGGLAVRFWKVSSSDPELFREGLDCTSISASVIVPYRAGIAWPNM